MPAWGVGQQGARSLCRTTHQRESESESESESKRESESERQRRMSNNAPPRAAATF
jgi:hypothetical protein